jgi:hypothetical protein
MIVINLFPKVDQDRKKERTRRDVDARISIPKEDLRFDPSSLGLGESHHPPSEASMPYERIASLQYFVFRG